jgi:PAS domain-containing protein
VIEGSSILPLIAAFFGAFLATYSAWTVGRGHRTRFFFSILCGLTVVWAFGQFLVLNSPDVIDPLLATPGEPMHFVGTFMILAASGVPACWLLFAASISGYSSWTRGWRASLVYLLSAYTFAVGATNPWHKMFVSSNSLGEIVYGPLAFPYILVMYVLIGIGAWMIWRGARKDRGALAVSQARTIGLAVLLPLLGGIVWNARHLIGQPFTVNPVPTLFIAFDAVIAFEVFRGGLPGLQQDSARKVMESSTDAVIIVDDTLNVRAVNAAAKHVFPRMKIGSNLRDIAPDIGRHATFCLEYGCDDLSFEIDTAGRVHWGRVRRSGASDGHPGGCVILLSDLTDLRRAQHRLLAAGRTADGQPASIRYSERVTMQ